MRRAAPARTCVGCRRIRPKQELIRLVRRPGGAVVRDPAGPGRGAYVCDDPACMERALKGGRLAQAFRTSREMVGVATINDAVSGR
ncbi:MAG: YlxR family protein [Candidatus Rokuibacteriota bacterium]